MFCFHKIANLLNFLSRNKKKYLLKSRDHPSFIRLLKTFGFIAQILQCADNHAVTSRDPPKQNLLMDFDCALCPSLWFLRAVDELVGIDEGSDACDDIMTYGFAT